MPLVFAAAASHAPGITAWPDAPPAEQRDTVYGAFAQMRARIARRRSVDALIVLTSEHWANFFLDHIGAFCVGRARRSRARSNRGCVCAKTDRSGRSRSRDADHRGGVCQRRRAELRVRIGIRSRHDGAAAFPYAGDERAGGADHVQHARVSATDGQALLPVRRDHRRRRARVVATHRHRRDRRHVARSGRARSRHDRFGFRPRAFSTRCRAGIRRAHRASPARDSRRPARARSNCSPGSRYAARSATRRAKCSATKPRRPGPPASASCTSPLDRHPERSRGATLSLNKQR